MIGAVPRREARLVTRLPEHLHHRGPPAPWTRMTRPGQDLHSFLEGPLFDAEGAMLLVDVPHGRILRITPDFSRWDVLFRYEGEPHAVHMDAQGRLILTDYRRDLLRVDLGSGDIETLCGGYAGEAFRGLSDLAVDRDGAVWFTDSGRTSLTDPRGRLFRLDLDGNLTCVLDCVPYPNGIAFSPDGSFVFLAATRANAVWRLGRQWLGAQPMAGTYVQLSGGLGPDGLSVSPCGHLAVAHAQAGRVWVFDPMGDPVACVLTSTGSWTTAVRFGGPDGRTLYILEAQAGAVLAWDLSDMRAT